ncbi:hypothetical protein LTR96_001878 [Exophiala xenobiotica]|nr:hypothetical protein LTS06_011167 [Exophiala xenobiotica]KAK5272248.1 hypothetical protein LTR96_001878 [Exophiala xenobiotica]KAK5282005.1 hypothetical protein LTR40_003954 [Exophiala xenobiotica]KAK5321946.1 hypothetical protein LTR93_006184 [Exophiala xenobiotica]KAK5401266.1 hypothetical protein LTR79_001785 [Exophiala xenobiotica]
MLGGIREDKVTPFVELYAPLQSDEDDRRESDNREEQPNVGDGCSVIRLFMHDENMADTCLPQEDFVAGYCAEPTLGSLQGQTCSPCISHITRGAALPNPSKIIDLTEASSRSGTTQTFTCVLSGADEWRWVAYTFVDSLFDGADGENAEQCQKDILEGFHAEPFGYDVADKPIEEAGESVLDVINMRAKQISQEWERVVNKPHKGFRKYRRKHKNQSRRPRHQTAAAEVATKFSEEIEESLDWFVGALTVLNDLLDVMTRTCNAWSEFS